MLFSQAARTLPKWWRPGLAFVMMGKVGAD